MQISSTNNTSFKSRFVPNKTFRYQFDRIAESFHSRMEARTIDAILNDGKNDVIEFTKRKEELVIKVNNQVFDKVECTPAYSIHDGKNDGTVGALRLALKALAADRNLEIKKHNYSDYEKSTVDAGINKLKEKVNDNNDRRDKEFGSLFIFDRAKEVESKLGLDLEALSWDKMRELRKNIFQEK